MIGYKCFKKLYFENDFIFLIKTVLAMKKRCFYLLILLMYCQAQAQQADIEATTFHVCDVDIAEKPLKQVPYEKSVEVFAIRVQESADLQNKKNKEDTVKYTKTVEDFSQRGDSLVSAVFKVTTDYNGQKAYSAINPFMYAVHTAYASHRPLVLSPDMVWLVICQGFAKHVTENAETLRHHFVEHEGTKNIEIFRNDFIKGSRNNDWESAFAQFTDSIKNYVGEELHSLVVADFSTTTPVEQAAFDISLMDAMSEYFTYQMTITCGIPDITLEGTPKDWQWIEDHIDQFAQYDLEWWTSELKPILHQFTRASKGKADVDFWKDIYNIQVVGCGSQTITGWVNKLFPYLKSGPRVYKNQVFSMSDSAYVFRTSKKIEEGEHKGKYREITHKFTTRAALMKFAEQHQNTPRTFDIAYHGPDISLDNFFSGLSSANLIFNDNGALYKMTLTAGFVGVGQDKTTKALRPEIAWAVIDDGRPPNKEEIEKMKR